jgi:hypothetical protein
MGFVAVNRFDRGYKRLQEGRIDDFLKQSTAYADILADIQSSKNCLTSPDAPITTNGKTLPQTVTPINIIPNSVTSAEEQCIDSVQIAIENPVQSEADCDGSGTDDSSSQATSGANSLTGSDSNSDSEEESDIDRSDEHLVSGRNRNIYSTFNGGDVDSESDSSSEVADQSATEDEDEEEDEDEDEEGEGSEHSGDVDSNELFQ